MLKHDISFLWNKDKGIEPSIAMLFRLDIIFRTFLDEVQTGTTGETKVREVIKAYIWGSTYLECLVNYLVRGSLRYSFELSVPAIPGKSALLAEVLGESLERQNLGSKLEALAKLRGKPHGFDAKRKELLQLIEKRNFLVHYKANPTELPFSEIGFGGLTVEQVLLTHAKNQDKLKKLNERLPDPMWVQDLMQENLDQLVSRFQTLGDWLLSQFDIGGKPT